MAGAVPADDLPGGTVPADDLPTATPVSSLVSQAAPSPGAMAAADMPEWERRAAAVGGAMSAPFEAAGQLYEHLAGRGAAADTEAQERARAMQELYKASAKESAGMPDVLPGVNPAAAIVNRLARTPAGSLATGTDVAGGFLLPALKAAKGAGAVKRILTGAGTGGLYGLTQPVVTGGDYTTEKLKQAGWGAAAGGMLTGAIEGLTRIPGAVSRLTAKAPPVERPTGEAAERVTGELQRTRDLMEGKRVAPPTPGAPLSKYETAVQDLEKTTKPLRESAFASGATVDMQHPLAVIDKLESQNVDKKVLAALAEARATIERSVKLAGGGAEAVATKGGHAMPGYIVKDGKLVKSADIAPENVAPIHLADEVRQSLERQIQQRGDAALDDFTKKQLRIVQQAVTAKARQASPDYGKYLDEYSRGAKELERFTPGATVLGRVTSGEPGARTLSGQDAQDALGQIFSGKTRERDFKDLVEMTGHSPTAQHGLRQSLAEWISKPEPVTLRPDKKAMLTRWEQVRGPAQKSGLLTAEHVKSIDAVMDDLRHSMTRAGVRKHAATVGGFFAGMPIGHPFMGSHFARDFAMDTGTKGAQTSAENMVSTMAISDAERAAMLAKPNTPKNVSDFIKTLEQGGAVSAGIEAGKGTPPTKRRSISEMTGMQPRGF